MSDLTPKQARFVEKFLIDLNAKEAAIRAARLDEGVFGSASGFPGASGRAPGRSDNGAMTRIIHSLGHPPERTF